MKEGYLKIEKNTIWFLTKVITFTLVLFQIYQIFIQKHKLVITLDSSLTYLYFIIGLAIVVIISYFLYGLWTDVICDILIATKIFNNKGMFKGIRKFNITLPIMNETLEHLDKKYKRKLVLIEGDKVRESDYSFIYRIINEKLEE